MARLAAMPRAKGLIAAAAIAAALVAGCGSSDPEPSIPREDAQELIDLLAAIQTDVGEGDCEFAEASVEDLKTAVANLPSEVDEDVRQGLENGADQLGILINDPEQCEQPEEATTTEETTTETTTEETEPTTTEETTTTQPTTPTTPTNPGGGSGGLGPPQQGGP